MAYAGDLTPTEAHDMLESRDDAILVDCRTEAEWTFVGVPSVTNARFIEWTQWPQSSQNANFVSDVAGGLEPSQPVLLLCRSGGRSEAAAHALTEAGFTEVYNITDGFEGHLNSDGHRAGGWKAAGLPWHQG